MCIQKSTEHIREHLKYWSTFSSIFSKEHYMNHTDNITHVNIRYLYIFKRLQRNFPPTNKIWVCAYDFTRYIHFPLQRARFIERFSSLPLYNNIRLKLNVILVVTVQVFRYVRSKVEISNRALSKRKQFQWNIIRKLARISERWKVSISFFLTI